MKKPSALNQLLEEMQGEGIHSDVDVVKTSKAVLYLSDEAAENEDGVELTGRECALLFANLTTVERFIDALEDADNASISLFDVGLSGAVLEELERNFVAVDEG